MRRRIVPSMALHALLAWGCKSCAVIFSAKTKKTVKFLQLDLFVALFSVVGVFFFQSCSRNWPQHIRSFCEFLVFVNFYCSLDALYSISNGEALYVYFVKVFPRFGGIFTLQMTPNPVFTGICCDNSIEKVFKINQLGQ